MKRPRSPARDLSLVSCPLVPESLRDTLVAARFRSLDEVLALDAGQLEERTGLSKGDAAQVLAAVAAWCGGHSSSLLCAVTEMGPRAVDTGQAELSFVRNSALSHLTVGGASFNELLGDEGLPSGKIVELVGPAAVGKTQLCMWCAARVALTHPTRSVLFISSSNTVSIERLMSFLPASLSASQLAAVLSRIVIVNCFDYEQLLSTLYLLRHDVQWRGRGVDAPPGSLGAADLVLVIVDSIAPLLQPLLSKQPFGHSLLFVVRSLLLDIGAASCASVIVTNITLASDFGGEGATIVSTTSSTKSAMGKSWELVASPRIWFDFDASDPLCALLTVRGLGLRYAQRACVMTIGPDSLTFRPVPQRAPK